MQRGELVRSYTAEAGLSKYQIVKFGANDGGCLPAAGSTDKLLGVTRDVVPAAADITAGYARVEIIRDGITRVQLGGTVTRGDWITSDASGFGVTAAPAAGVNAEVIGKAEVSGVSGDWIDVCLDFNRIQG